MAPQFLSRMISYFTFAFNINAKQAGHSPDGREQAMLEYVLENAEKGNVESIIKAIDDFTYHNWMTTLGNEKGSILEDIVKKFDPRVVLELGTYCGYSTIRIAANMNRPDSKILSIETNPENCIIANELIAYAGLSSKVEILIGTFSDCVNEVDEFLEIEEAQHFDMVFMDHFKEYYLPDFQLLKDRRMLGIGSAIVADSKSFPTANEYLRYLKEHPEEVDTEEVQNSDVKLRSWLPCTLTLSVFKPDLGDHINILVH